jgi:phosphotransferase system HPr-like phosphotransfer protein
MTQWSPVWKIEINSVEYTDVTLSNLTISSGRTNIYEQAQAGYANVTLNGLDYGLHLNIETMNKQLLSRWGITSSHLYKGAVPYFPDFYAGNEYQFAIESGSDTNTSDLTSFIQVQSLGGPAWWAEMTKIANMKQMTLGWATELYSGHWDGYVVNKNNYFLNFDNYGKVTLLPWGTDQTWNGSLSYFSSPALMINKCWAVPACYAMYQQSLSEVANKAELLDLETMAGEVAYAISDAASQDPLGPSYDVVTDHQNATIWRLGNQLRSLQTRTAPWDTGLQSISVNSVEHSIGSTIYLPAGTRQVSVEAITNELNATAIVSSVGIIKDGMNTISLLVTSANGLHTRTEPVSIYVLTARTAKSSMAFSKVGSKLTSRGTSSLNILIAKLASSQKLVITVSMPKSKTMSIAKNNILLKQRTDLVVKALSAKGIKATTVTKALTSSGVADSLTLSATYVD